MATKVKTGVLGTLTELNFADNGKARFGAGNDLQIYHDTNNSYIDDAGTGGLSIRSNLLQIGKYTGELSAQFVGDGESNLYYDNSKKIATTSSGIDVTGTATMDGLTVDGAGDISGNTYVNSGNGSGVALKIGGEGGNGLKTQYIVTGSSHTNFQVGVATHASSVFSITPSTAAGNTTFTNTALNIDGSGNVGIGVTNPSDYNNASDNLVVGSSGDTGITIVSGTSSNSMLAFADGTGGTAGYRGRVDYNHADDSMKFNTAATERMRIDSSGHVVIQDDAVYTTNAPNGRGSLILAGASGGTGFGGLEFHTNSGGGAGYGTKICASDAVQTFARRNNSATWTESMRIASGGQLLVGTTTQRTFFDVQGTTTSDVMTVLHGSTANANVGMIIFRDGAADFCGQITSNGSTNTTAYNTSSDARLKNVLGEAKGLEVINQLNPVHFEWKKSGLKQDGLIAQEVEAIVPNAITYNEESDVYSMDYSKLVTPLIKAIQEQQAQIDELKAKLESK